LSFKVGDRKSIEEQKAAIDFEANFKKICRRLRKQLLEKYFLIYEEIH